MISTQTWHVTFVAQLSSVNLMATASLFAPSLMDVAQQLANPNLSLYPFDDILTWPFKGTIQISV